MQHCSCAHKQKRRHFHAKTTSAKLYIYITYTLTKHTRRWTYSALRHFFHQNWKCCSKWLVIWTKHLFYIFHPHWHTAPTPLPLYSCYQKTLMTETTFNPWYSIIFSILTRGTMSFYIQIRANKSKILFFLLFHNYVFTRFGQ